MCISWGRRKDRWRKCPRKIKMKLRKGERKEGGKEGEVSEKERKMVEYRD